MESKSVKKSRRKYDAESMEQLRTEILGSTINIMSAWGYKNPADITLATFLRDLGPLYSKGFYNKHDLLKRDHSVS